MLSPLPWLLEAGDQIPGHVQMLSVHGLWRGQTWPGTDGCLQNETVLRQVLKPVFRSPHAHDTLRSAACPGTSPFPPLFRGVGGGGDIV